MKLWKNGLMMNDCKEWKSLIQDIPPKNEILLVRMEDFTNAFLISSNDLITWKNDKSKKIPAFIGIEASVINEEKLLWKVI